MATEPTAVAASGDASLVQNSKLAMLYGVGARLKDYGASTFEGVRRFWRSRRALAAVAEARALLQRRCSHAAAAARVRSHALGAAVLRMHGSPGNAGTLVVVIERPLHAPSTGAWPACTPRPWARRFMLMLLPRRRRRRCTAAQAVERGAGAGLVCKARKHRGGAQMAVAAGAPGCERAGVGSEQAGARRRQLRARQLACWRAP